MAASMTIGKLALATGVPTSTLRYYERVGLLRENERSGSNYRLYDLEIPGRVRFIRAAQSAGFTLEDIRTLLAYRDGERAPCGEIRAMIEHRLARVDERMHELEHLHEILTGYLSACRRADKKADCHVLGKLEP